MGLVEKRDGGVVGPYRVLVADPAWKFKDKLPGKTRGAEKQYACMPVALNLAVMTAWMDEHGTTKDALLFCWRVAAMQPEALELIRKLGFKPKTEIVWQKLTKKGKPHFGMGWYTRASHETCLVATRGRGAQLIKSHSIRSTFSAPIPLTPAGRYDHSAKPEAFFDLVEELVVEAPKLEMFARRHRPGWTCVGNQVDSRPSLGVAA